MSRPVAVVLLLVCALLWGFAFVAQKGAMAHMGPLTFIGVRFALGGIIVAPLAIREYRRQRSAGIVVTRAQWQRIGVLCLAFFLGNVFQQAALMTATVTNGGFLTSLYVILTPLVGFVLSRTRPHPIIYLGAPLALAGIYMLTGARLDHLTVGDGLLVICAACWAVHVALLGPLTRETGLPIAISTLSFLASAIVGLLAALLFEHPSPSGIGAGWIEILYAGGISTAVAFTFQALGQQHVPAANAAIILSSESLFAGLAGALLLGERLTPIGYVGAAIIFIAIVMVEVVPSRRRGSVSR